MVVIPALAVARDAPRDDDALSMLAPLAVTRVPKVLDADKTEALVFVTLVLTVESVEPKDEDAPSTVPLTVVIWLDSEVDAPVTKLLVPVIAERMDDVAVPIRVSVLALTLV